MAYAFTQDLPVTPEIWQRVKSEMGPEPAKGLILHLVVRNPNGSGLRYIDVWESKEDCDRFLNERIHPIIGGILAAAGRPRPPEPTREELAIVDLMGAGLPAASGR